MLSLTQRPPVVGNLSMFAGKMSHDSLTDHWDRAIELARNLVEANKKVDEWAKKTEHRQHEYYWTYWLMKSQKLRAEIRDAVPAEYRRLEPEKIDERIDYLWQKECELNTDSDHYHWHYHVVLKSKRFAELLNACWQATSEPWMEGPSGYCQSEFSTVDDLQDHDSDFSGERVARELSMYLAGTRSGAFLNEVPGHVVGDYFAQLRNVCLYASSGDWRPIGVTRDADSEDPVVAVAWSDCDRWYTWSEWWDTGRHLPERAGSEGIGRVPEQVVSERPEAVDKRASEILEQLRNEISKSPTRSDVENLESSGLSPPKNLWQYRIEAGVGPTPP